ncbi:cdc42 effector protein 1 [Tiliqua scincoides]|uniref:cdc42 effector protein 1 n=1 Tax=Tiliqua scincoides TaxID=71010 RepID=UPI003462C897
MSLGKLPVIGWVSGSHSKRRLKTELTPDMISPPLRDFRHTMHVGRGGDAFGDTSFLRNHGGKEAKYNNFFARTLRHVKRSPLRNRGSRSKEETSPTPPEISPIIKNAVSLPQLNESNYGNDGFGMTFAFKSTPNSFSDYGLESGFCTIPRFPRSEKTQESSCVAESALTRSDSLLSFRLDLGPSLMSELLHVMSFSGDSSHGSSRGKEEREEIKAPTIATTDTFSPLHLKSTRAEDSLPWRSGSPHASCEESPVGSNFWGHSEPSLPLGHSVCHNGDSHSLELSQDGSPYSRRKSLSSKLGAVATEGVMPRETPWQGYQHDCNMESSEYNRAAQVLARHYSPGGTYCDLPHQEESRSQASWESPDANTWRLKAGAAARQEHMARWCQRAEEKEEEEEAEEEEEEEEEEFSGDGATIVRERNSDSFEYVDDEEEDDEVKV